LIQKSKGSRTALPLTDIRPLLPELTERLQGVIQQMIDPDFVYAATANTEICQWCGYKEICGR
jgi:CRISPR/Cas system-associated exonuclease Cas4 (RecB family)